MTANGFGALLLRSRRAQGISRQQLADEVSELLASAFTPKMLRGLEGHAAVPDARVFRAICDAMQWDREAVLALLEMIEPPDGTAVQWIDGYVVASPSP